MTLACVLGAVLLVTGTAGSRPLFHLLQFSTVKAKTK